MTISSPLEIPWAHAYWTEGPLFTALGYSDGGSVDTFPDEMAAPSSSFTTGMIRIVPPGVAGEDLVQGTAGNKPVFRSSSAGMNSKPIIEFDGSNDYLSKAFASSLSQLYTVVGIFRVRGGISVADNHFIVATNAGAATGTAWHIGWSTFQRWYFLGNSGGATGTAYDTTKHLFRREVNNFADKLWIDESLNINSSANIGTNLLSGLSIGAGGNGAAAVQVDFAFVAVIGRSLTGTEASDLHSWSTGYYGTA